MAYKKDLKRVSESSKTTGTPGSAASIKTTDPTPTTSPNPTIMQVSAEGTRTGVTKPTATQAQTSAVTNPAPIVAPAVTSPMVTAPAVTAPVVTTPAATTPAATQVQTPSSGTTQTTTTQAAEVKPFSYNDFSYGNYTESDAVKQANALLQQQIANKPGSYQSQWQDEISDYMNQISNRDPFSYNFNEDALYNQYKDNYIQQGQMAMMDTMGQAAAMTGGYGNSYAQTVGQQAYNQQLNQLNNVIPELYQMAYDRYSAEGQHLQDMLGMYQGLEDQDYGRYMDSYNAWQTERDYLANRYDTERANDYSRWETDRALAYDQYSADRNLAYDEYQNALNMAYQQERDAISDAQWQAQFDEDKRRYEASRNSGAGNGGPNYVKVTTDIDAYWAKEFQKVNSQEALDLLAMRMETQNYSPDYIDSLYRQYAGTYGGQQPIDTSVDTISQEELKKRKQGNTASGIYRVW